jgi:hypothetical protein
MFQPWSCPILTTEARNHTGSRQQPLCLLLTAGVLVVVQLALQETPTLKNVSDWLVLAVLSI